jgi:hypothetical protein
VTGFKAGWSDLRPPQHNVSFVADSNDIEIPGFIIDQIEAFVDLGVPFSANGKDRWGSNVIVTEWLRREQICLRLARNACRNSDKDFGGSCAHTAHRCLGHEVSDPRKQVADRDTSISRFAKISQCSEAWFRL